MIEYKTYKIYNKIDGLTGCRVDAIDASIGMRLAVPYFKEIEGSYEEAINTLNEAVEDYIKQHRNNLRKDGKK